MGTKIASLEIELAMATGGAIADVNRFGGVVDKVSAEAIRELDRIDTAMKNVGGLDAATASMVRMAGASAKTAVETARELARIERAGESMATGLERQLSVFGKTAEEVRALKAETAAYAASIANMPELAARIRETEQALEREERAVRQAASAYEMFEARARQAMQVYQSQQAVEAAAAKEREAVAVRNAGVAYQMFEARVRAGAEAMREQEAAAVRDAAAVARLRELLDPAAAAQDRLNREIEEARRVMIAAGASAEELARAEALLTQRSIGVVGSTGNMKIGMQQMSFQLNDIATMWAMQARPMQIFASQAGQVIQSMQLMAGESKGLLGLLGGQWGMLITTAAVVLVPLISNMIKLGDKTAEATDKLKKEAEETERSRVAHDRFKASAEGVAAAIRDGTEATRQSIAAMNSSAEAANIEANANLRHEISIRKRTSANLEAAIAEENLNKIRAQGIGERGDMGALAANESARRVADLRQQLDQQTKLIGDAEKRVQATRVDLAVEAAQRAADPMERIKHLYDEHAEAAKRAAHAQAAAGKEVTAALTRELTMIERNRQAAIKAEQDRTAAAKQTANQIGRNITLSEARGIAEGVGGRVTSDHRTLAEQTALYAKYSAYKAGTGPWAALAAKPGTSNHELDQALDVAKTDGMTLKKLVSAYRAAGVKLVEALDEGSHFHIAWAKVGEAAKQPTAERTAAARAIREAAEFDLKMAAERLTNMGQLHAEVVKLMEDAAKPFDLRGLDRAMDRIGDANAKDLDKNGPLAQVEQASAIGAAVENAMSGGFRDVTRSILGMQDVVGLAFGPASPLVRTLGDLASGAGIGSSVAGAMGGSKVLGALGGAIGGEVGKQFLTTGLTSISSQLGGMAGPLGSIAGGVIASFAGSLLTSTKKAATTIGAIGDQLGVIETVGNSAKREKATAAAANDLLSSLGDLATQLGGELGSGGRVSIGIRDKNYRVDPTGGGATKVKKGAIDFGEDQQAAIEYALRDLIADGAITGLRAATSRLLNSGTDLERQVQKAMDFEGVFSALKQATDPMGYAVEQLDKQFSSLRATFREAGASIEETTQLEQLYQIRRDAIAKQDEDRIADRRRLEARLLEAQGDTAGALAITRQIELASTDASLRTLQQQIYAAEDGQEAVKAAEQLRDAWKSVGDTIMDEVRRIRGLGDATGGNSFATLLGQFNAANAAARTGDIDAAKNLPQLSKSLLDAAAQAATSRQELDRVQAQTAAMLEATYAAIGGGSPAEAPTAANTAAALANLSAVQAATGSAAASNDMVSELRALREEMAGMRTENKAGHAATAGNTGSIDRRLAAVTEASSGEAITVASVAA
jgi:hypothetical protein